MNGNSILTPKQDTFCREYLVDLNATAAARRAGYSNGTAHVQGPRLLANVRVAERIEELQSEAAERAEVTVDEVIEMLRQSYRDAKAANQFGPAVRSVELLGKRLGMFRDHVVTEHEGAAHTEEIIKALANGDPRKERLARELLGSDEEFAPLDPVEPEPE